MAITIAVKALASRRLRRKVAETGLRKMQTGTIFKEEVTEGFWEGLSKKIKGFFDFSKISFSSVVSFLFRTGEFLFNFNWNIQPEQVEELIDGYTIRLSGELGALAGQTLGRVVCGFIPGAVITSFNPALGAVVLRDVGEEALERLCEETGEIIDGVVRNVSGLFLLYSYANLRSLGKKRRLQYVQRLQEKGLATREQVQQAQQDLANKEPWILAEKIEEYVDSIPDARTRAFAEEFLENFGEACVEAGFVVANSLDTQFYLNRLGNESQQTGRQKTVQISISPQ